MKLSDTFYCRSARRNVTVEYCTDSYVDANGFTPTPRNVTQKKKSGQEIDDAAGPCGCRRCAQGAQVRADFGASA